MEFCCDTFNLYAIFDCNYTYLHQLFSLGRISEYGELDLLDGNQMSCAIIVFAYLVKRSFTNISSEIE